MFRYYLVPHLPKAVASLASDGLTPTVVVIDIGSNDLAHVDVFKPKLVLELATRVTDFALALRADRVIINAILPRTGHMTCDVDTFRDNTDLYNVIVNDYCDSEPGLRFNKMRGLSQTILSRLATQQERERPPRPVSDWSDDGIHCDRPRSQRIYSSCVKFALLEAAFSLSP